MAIDPPQRRAPDLHRSDAAQNLIRLLSPLVAAATDSASATTKIAQLRDTSLQAISCKEILSAIEALVPTLIPESPIFATFHDGKVHDPLGGGSYAFQKDLVEPMLRPLLNDETLANDKRESLAKIQNKENTSSGSSPLQIQLPTRPIVIHAGAQPNNSPHAGTLVVLLLRLLLRSTTQKTDERGDSQCRSPATTCHG